MCYWPQSIGAKHPIVHRPFGAISSGACKLPDADVAAGGGAATRKQQRQNVDGFVTPSHKEIALNADFRYLNTSTMVLLIDFFGSAGKHRQAKAIGKLR